MIILALIFPIIGFILQTYTRLFNKSFGVDVWTRLLEVGHVRINGHRIPGKISGQFMIEGYFDYPPVMPFLLSFFSKAQLEKYKDLVAPFIDALNNLLVFGVAYYFTRDIYIGLVAQAVYTLTPVIALENSQLTPRSLGYFNFNLAFISSLIYVQSGHWWALIGSVIFTTLIFLSHRFAAQSLFFISIFFSFYQQTWYYFGIFWVGFLLAVALTKGYYLRVLRGHLYNIYFWIPNREYRFAHQIRGLQKDNKKRDFVEFIYTMLSKFAPVTMIGTNIWVVVAFVTFALQYIIGTRLGLVPTPEIFQLAVWVLFFYFLGIPILMMKIFRCIGEGYRYLEMAALPTSVLAGWLFMSVWGSKFQTLTMVVYGFVFLINLGLIVSVHRTIIKDRNRSVTKDMDAAFKFLNSKKVDLKILCIPHQNTTTLIYHTKQKVFVNADNAGLMTVQAVYPVIQGKLKDTIKKFGINAIFLKESFAKVEELKLGKVKELFRSGDLVLLKVG